MTTTTTVNTNLLNALIRLEALAASHWTGPNGECPGLTQGEVALLEARKAIQEAQKAGGHDLALEACQALADAYDAGEARGGSVAWEDINDAYALACRALAWGQADSDADQAARVERRELIAAATVEIVKRDESCRTCEGSGRVGPASFNPEMDEAMEPCPECGATQKPAAKPVPRPRLAILLEKGVISVVTDNAIEYPRLKEIELVYVCCDVDDPDPEEFLVDLPCGSGGSKPARVAFLPVLDSSVSLDPVFDAKRR